MQNKAERGEKKKGDKAVARTQRSSHTITPFNLSWSQISNVPDASANLKNEQFKLIPTVAVIVSPSR